MPSSRSVKLRKGVNVLADLLALPSDVRADLIRGKIVLRTESSFQHENPLPAGR